MDKLVKEITTQLSVAIARYFESYTDLNQLQFEFPQVDFSVYIPYCKFSADKYSREILYSEKNFEIILIGWGVNQYTPFHDHSKNGCVMKVLKGEVQETRLFKDKTQSVAILKSSDCSYISNLEAVHSIENISSENAISLHVYSPPGYVSEKIKF